MPLVILKIGNKNETSNTYFKIRRKPQADNTGKVVIAFHPIEKILWRFQFSTGFWKKKHMSLMSQRIKIILTFIVGDRRRKYLLAAIVRPEYI